MPNDAATLIMAANAGRIPELAQRKYKAMRDSRFSFYRGTCHLFFTRLAEMNIPAVGPPAWNCNDLHIENFGTYVGDNSLNYFDLNDFDEAALAPAEWEIVRLATSILIAAPELNVKRVGAERLAQAVIAAYATELRGGQVRWIERRTATGAIGELMKGLKQRDMQAFLDSRTKKRSGRRELRIDDRRALPLSKAQKLRLSGITRSINEQIGDPRYFTLIDGALRVAGTGSLGIERFVLLVDGPGPQSEHRLLDVKSARPSAAVAISPYKQPKWAHDGARIVTIQSRCQALPPLQLRSIENEGAAFVVKELQPTADRLDLERLAEDFDGLRHSIESMGRLAAWAQLRSSGRQGSATADDFAAYAEDGKLGARVLETSRALTERLDADWHGYVKAYDGGQLRVTEAAAALATEKL